MVSTKSNQTGDAILLLRQIYDTINHSEWIKTHFCPFKLSPLFISLLQKLFIHCCIWMHDTNGQRKKHYELLVNVSLLSFITIQQSYDAVIQEDEKWFYAVKLAWLPFCAATMSAFIKLWFACSKKLHYFYFIFIINKQNYDRHNFDLAEFWLVEL